MELTWPLVGRSSELQRVDQLLEAGNGSVVLAGSAGVGKTRLAGECLGRAEARGYFPLRVSATSATSALPFGAFAHLLPEQMGAPNRANLLGQIVRSITASGGDRPVAILVDDAHLLDESSAALTHLLVQARNCFLMATLRSGHPASDAVVALWKDGLAERIEVPPLRPEQVKELLRGALGGPMEGSSVALFQQAAQGNALFLRELVLASLDSGLLSEVAGVWRVTGHLPISPRLAEIVAGRLANLTVEERKALEVVALGEPMGVDTLLALEPAIGMESLESKGLVRVERDNRRLTLHLDHPLHGEVLRAQLSPLLIRRTSRDLADVVERFGARRKTDVLAVGVWRLEGGGTVRPDTMLRAALSAQQRNDYPLAERLARSALEGGAGFEAALLVGQLLWQQHRAAEADRHLESLRPSALSDRQKALLAGIRIDVLDLGLNDAEGSFSAAEEAEESIEQVAFRDQVTAERARVLGRHGRNREAVAIVEPLLNRAEGRTLVAACFAAATSMSVTGQYRRSLEATELGYNTQRSLTGPPLGYPSEIHLALRCQSYLFAGYLKDAERLALTQYGAAVSEHSPLNIGFFCAFLGMHAVMQGRGQSAIRWAGEGLTMFQRLGIPLMERNALALMCFGQALQGDHGGARRSLAQLDLLGVREADHIGPLLLQAAAWTEWAGGDPPKAVELLWRAVEMARWSGTGAVESWALHELARLGLAEQVRGPLEDLCSSVEGPFARARAAHASALSDQDAGGLEASATEFEELDAIILAAEAAAEAAVLWRRLQEPRRATLAERRSQLLALKCEGARSPALTAVPRVRAVLTPRELEIVNLAAAGMADKEIARRLFLSHRTVENRLHSAYSKLGVSNRSELGGVLEGL